MTVELRESQSNTSLQEVCSRISSGGTPSRKRAEFFENGNHLWVKSQELRDGSIHTTEEHITDEALANSSAKLYPKNTVLIAMYGATVGKLGLLRQQASVNQAICALVVDEQVADYKFVFYYLIHNRGNLVSKAFGAAQQNLNQGLIRNFKISLLPLPTQRKIASVLSAYDDLIENNTRRIQILEEMAQMIYREWFVDFRFPGHEKVMMAKPGLGRIPEGWKVRKLSEVASVYRGRSYKSAEIVERGGLPFLNLKCVDRDGGFRREGIKRYEGPYKTTQTAKPGDIVMAVTDMTQERRIIARAARVPAIEQETSVFSMDLVKIEPNTEVASDYLYGMLRFSTFPDEVKQHANGVNVLHLNPSHIEGYGFVLPPTGLRNQYSEICSGIYRQSDLLHLKNENLRRTRDVLLPKLISGEVDVEDSDVGILR